MRHRSIALVLFVSTVASGQDTPVSGRGVDLVVLKSDERLFGFVLERNEDDVAIAIRRDWLKAKHAALYPKLAAEEEKEYRAAYEKLKERIAAWKRRRADDKQLIFYLDEQLEIVDRKLAAPTIGTSDLLLVRVAAGDAKRILVQPAQRRQIALVAWQEKLPDIETRSSISLAAELRKGGVKDVADRAVDLSEELPPVTQTDRQWAAKMAIVEYLLRKPLDFQGTDSFLIPTDGQPAAADFQRAMQEVVQGRMGELLGGKQRTSTASFASAIAIAKERDVIGFRVTRQRQDLAARSIVVISEFVAQMPDGDWEVVWSHSETASLSKSRPDAERQLAAAPEVRRVLQGIEAFGVPAAGPQFELAMRAGAATAEALRIVNSRFFAFRDRYANRLDQPAVNWRQRKE